jgi:pilus assembly protein CpaF
MPPDAAPSLAERVHARLLATGAGSDVDGLRSDAERLARAEAPLLAGDAVRRVVDAVAARVRGLGPLDPLLADPEVSEVMVNGPGAVWVERAGRLERVDLTLDAATTAHLIERVVGPLGLRVDRAAPLVDARLPDGSRVNAVVPPLAVDGPCLTIRRFVARRVVLDEVCPPGVAPLLAWAVRARLNVLVSGGTGAGKTTLLNALAAEIPAGERVVTVEDAAELQLPRDHVVRLEARPASAEGAGEVPVRDLVRNALRMRPDRIVVGECRGPEALDMLQAMNTGHEGSLSTCHANGPADALRRLETMVLMGSVALPLAAVREQVDAALDLVVQVARRPGGSRAVVELAELAPERPVRVRRLAGPAGLEELPGRGPRLPGTPPADPEWVVR